MSMILTLLVVLCQTQAPEGPTAREVLERAAVFQRGATPIERPSSFHGRFFLTARKPDGAGTVSLDIERRYVRSPERMLTRRSETSLTNLDSDEGYDDGTIWLRDRHTGEVVVCNDDPETFVHEMAQVREQLRLSRLILDVITVDGLAARLTEPRWIGESTLDLGSAGRARDQRRVDLVVGRLPDELFGPDSAAPPPLPGSAPPELQVELAVDRDSGALYRVHLTTLRRSEPLAYEVRMKNHRPNRQGLQVPSTLRVIDGAGDELAVIGADQDADGFPALSFDQPVDLGLFSVPKAELEDPDVAPVDGQ